MTVDPAMLLQMLEPAVRPGKASAGSGVQQGKPAFENRSFDDLLSEARATTEGDSGQATAQPTQADPLGALGGLGQIENAGLREVLAQANGSASTSETDKAA